MAELKEALLEAFLKSPDDKWVRGPHHMVWCAGPHLNGVMMWGAPTRAAMERFAASQEFSRGMPRFRALFDGELLERIDPEPLEVVMSLYRSRRESYIGQVEHIVVIPPRDPFLAQIVLGTFPMLRFPFPFETAPDLPRAMALLGADQLTAELMRVYELIRQSPDDAALATLRTAIRADLRHATLASVSRSTGLSERVLQRRLQELGTSFRRELTELRMEEAQRLLLGDEKLEAIALALGYADDKHLINAFRASFGCTPGEWRARNRR